MAEAQQTARLGMSVARKVAARAVDRNYMKRVIREVFRRHQSEFEGIDFVVAPRRVFSRRNYAAIEVELLGALLEARGKCLASCNG